MHAACFLLLHIIFACARFFQARWLGAPLFYVCWRCWIFQKSEKISSELRESNRTEVLVSQQLRHHRWKVRRRSKATCFSDRENRRSQRSLLHSCQSQQKDGSYVLAACYRLAIPTCQMPPTTYGHLHKAKNKKQEAAKGQRSENTNTPQPWLFDPPQLRLPSGWPWLRPLR